MVVNLLNNIKLSGHNEHLIDIFTENCYLELGNIHYHILRRLLEFEEIDYNDICSFDISDIGVGHSNISNKELKKKLPFYFFQNINTKNKNIQIFLTYGLFSYTMGNVERFAPIVLIPVNMHLKEDTITFQMLSKPIENRTLLDEINVSSRIINNAIKLDSLISIDRYVLSFENIDGCHVSFESFLTFAKSRTVNLRLDHKAFSFRKDSAIDLKSIKGIIENDEFFGVDPLSKDQRQALLSARNGNSFAISGRVGTGKTTTLINIALDAMINGKKVLYVSNIDETKKEVYNKLKSCKAENYFLDLTVPSTELPHFVYNNTKSEEVDSKEIAKEIVRKYNEILDYENKLFGRVCDFRYNEVLSELAVLSTKKIDYKPLDDLTVIYKHEYEQIAESVKNICDKVKKLNKLGIESISSSRFSEIPTNLDANLLNYNAIIKVLNNIRELFADLLEKKELLEKEYGFANIINFGRFGFIRIYVDGVNVEDIPRSWFEKTGKVFEEAKLRYRELENDMLVLDGMKLDLEKTYQNLNEISIDYEINQILGSTYKLDDYEKLDYINQHRQEINKLINRGGVERETFLNMSKKIRSFMKVNLNDEIKNINEIVRFADYICENRVDPIWIKYLNEDYLSRSIPKINESKKYIEEFNVLIKRFEKKITKCSLDEIPNLLNQFKKYEEETSNKKKKEYAFVHTYRKKNQLSSLHEEIQLIEEIVKLLGEINLHTSRYEKLVGHKYILGDDPIGGINKLVDYVKSIKNTEIKKRIIEYLGLMQWEFKFDGNSSNHVVFNLYRNSYRNLMDIYDELHRYVPLKNQSKMNGILNDMMTSFQYFREIFSSNDRMKEVIVNYNEPYVFVSEYIKLKQKLVDLFNHQQMLIQNNDYKYLYDKYYLDVDTDCREIKKIIDFYDYYQAIFKNYSLCVKSLSFKQRSELVKIFEEVKNIFELMGLNITTYNTIFKNSFTISYYNNTFVEVIKYLDKLLASKDELSLYLDCVENLQVIMKHKLYRWVNYLTNCTNIENIVDEFKFAYFKVVNEMYLKENELLTSNEVLGKTKALALELKAMNENAESEVVNKLRKVSIYRTNAKFMGNYDKYIEKVSQVKKIFFTNTKILNNFISIGLFDLILIDDIQAGASSDYGIALRANQVVFAGVEQLQTLFSSDVISRMRKSNVLSFKFRYYPTPKHLVNNMDGANSLIKYNKFDNIGVEVLKFDPSLFILSLLKENRNYRINVYCNKLISKRNLYESFASNALNDGFDEKEILSLLAGNINVCDVCEEYLIDSDYNILYLEEYSSIKFDNNATNMFDFILQTKKKLFIYDGNNLLEDEINPPSIFISKIKLLLETSNDIYTRLNSNNLLYSMAKVFRSNKIKVYDHHDNLDLLLEYKNKLYGVMIYFNHDISSFQTINDYLETYRIYIQSGMKVYNIMLFDIRNNLEGVVQQICEDIIHEQKKQK